MSRDQSSHDAAVLTAATILAGSAADDVYLYVNRGVRGNTLYAAVLCAGVAADQALEHERSIGHKVSETVRRNCLLAAHAASEAYKAGMRYV